MEVMTENPGMFDHPGDDRRYLARHTGETQSRRLSSAEQYANAQRQQSWQASLAGGPLDEDWVIDVISSGEQQFPALKKLFGACCRCLRVSKIEANCPFFLWRDMIET